MVTSATTSGSIISNDVGSSAPTSTPKSAAVESGSADGRAPEAAVLGFTAAGNGTGRRARPRVGDVGVHAGRDEHAHTDAGALELVAQRLGESDDRVLGCAVR